jgi:hypothetical protein
MRSLASAALKLSAPTLRRLHDFLARERIAGRNYTEYKALDLSVRNLTTEWRSEFRRLVKIATAAPAAMTVPYHSIYPCLSSPQLLCDTPPNSVGIQHFTAHVQHSRPVLHQHQSHRSPHRNCATYCGILARHGLLSW